MESWGNQKETVMDLTQGNTALWRSWRVAQSNKLETWAWTHFWAKQIRYWRQRQAEFPELIQVSREGVLVDRWLYEQLGQEDAHLWQYQPHNHWVGGYEDPSAHGLAGKEHPGEGPQPFPPRRMDDPWAVL
jgi:hypothetical protein